MHLLLSPLRLRELTRTTECDILSEKDSICDIHLLAARRCFAKENVSEPVRRLLDAFPPFEAQLCYGPDMFGDDRRTSGRWWISFQVYRPSPDASDMVVLTTQFRTRFSTISV